MNFPSGPSIGDEYTAPNNVVYTYDGVKWTAGGGTVVTVPTVVSAFTNDAGYVTSAGATQSSGTYDAVLEDTFGESLTLTSQNWYKIGDWATVTIATNGGVQSTPAFNFMNQAVTLSLPFNAVGPFISSQYPIYQANVFSPHMSGVDSIYAGIAESNSIRFYSGNVEISGVSMMGGVIVSSSDMQVRLSFSITFKWQ